MLRETKKLTTIRLKDSQKRRLVEMAEEIGVTYNEVLRMLIDNAEVRTVQKREPSATLFANNH